MPFRIEQIQLLTRVLGMTLLLCYGSFAIGQRPLDRSRLLEGVSVEKDIPYVAGGHERQKLDLYVPRTESNKKLPLVVWIHGGGWANGSKNGIGNCAWVLKEGYALASIGYRLTDAAVFPAQLDDCRAGIDWLKKNAGDRGVDTNRIVVWGSSAGGHLVSMLGTTGKPDDEGDDLQGVIDWFGPAELLTMQEQRTLPVRLNADAPDSFESRLVGGPLQEKPDEARAASPVSHVSSDDAPFLIMHGDQDALVSVTQSRTLFARLTESGVEAKLHILPGAGHGGKAFQSEETRDVIREFLSERLKGD